METIKVNTQDIIKGVAELADKKQKEVREVVRAMEEFVKAQVGQATVDTSVEIKLFNGLTVISEYAKPRTARNPRTGETLTTEGKNRVKAKIGISLKTAANQQ